MPYLTPDNSPTSFKCRVLSVPDDIQWRMIVNGVLADLLEAHNFQQFGAVTPEECVAVFSTMFFDYIDSECPMGAIIGEVRSFAFYTMPDGWLVCAGQTVSRETYADLFAVIGTAYGAGDGSTTFQLPNMRGRFPVGQLPVPGGDMVLGSTGGENSHVLTIGEMPSHSHKQNVQTGAGSGTGAFVQQQRSEQGARQTSLEGGDEAHENRPAYTAFEFGIYSGV